jgi:hypothetical protein
MTDHEHAPAHAGRFWEVCACGATREIIQPGESPRSPAWHACARCCSDLGRAATAAANAYRTERTP